jgi:transposase InsO family protein
MKAKASSRGEMGVLKAKECPKGPMNSVTIDFITGMPETTSLAYPGRKITQAAVLVDRFTKKCFMIPLPDTATAQEIAKAVYDSVFIEHGWPLELISDRDAKFTSKFWQELFRIVGTKLSMSYAYHNVLMVRPK